MKRNREEEVTGCRAALRQLSSYLKVGQRRRKTSNCVHQALYRIWINYLLSVSYGERVS